MESKKVGIARIELAAVKLVTQAAQASYLRIYISDLYLFYSNSNLHRHVLYMSLKMNSKTVTVH